MYKCPICGKDIKYFSWTDAGMITEWLYQCRPCNYMRHYYHGNYEYTVGYWRGIIRKADNKRITENVTKIFNEEIGKAIKLYKNKQRVKNEAG